MAFKKGQIPWNAQNLKKNCLVCEKEFTIAPSQSSRKYCSKICYDTVRDGIKHSKETKKKISEAHKGKKHSEETKRKLSEVNKGKISPMEGKTHSEDARRKMSEAREGKPGWNKGGKLSEEHKKKMSERMKGIKPKCSTKGLIPWNKGKKHLSGEKNPNWQGGKSFELYTIDWTETLRRSIRERDKYTCRMCGMPQSDTAYCIHHIDYNKNNNNPNNLTTLCRSCHTKTNFNREYWQGFLKGNET